MTWHGKELDDVMENGMMALKRDCDGLWTDGVNIARVQKLGY